MTWKQKLAEILRDAEAPLPPKQIADEFINRFGWQEKRSQLGNRVRSTLLFMKKDGNVSVDANGDYRLTTQEDLLK